MLLSFFSRIASLFSGAQKNDNAIEQAYLPRSYAISLSVEDKAKELVELVEAKHDISLFTKTQQFEDFKRELEYLFAHGLSPLGWEGLKEVVEHHAAAVDTLLASAQLYNQFLNKEPLPYQWNQLREAITIPSDDPVERDRLFQALATFIHERGFGYPRADAPDTFVELALEGRSTLHEMWNADFSDQQWDYQIKIMNAMARHQHHFRGVAYVQREVLASENEADLQFVETAFSNGFFGKESAQWIAHEIRGLRRQWGGSAQEAHALISACNEQMKVREKIIPLLKSASNIFYRINQEESPELIAPYCELVNALVDAGAKVDRLNLHHVRAYHNSSHSQYSASLAQHLIDVRDLHNTGRRENIMTQNVYRVLDDLEAAGPNPAALHAFEFLMTQINTKANSPTVALKNMGKLLKDFDLPPEEWKTMRMLLTAQVRNGSAVDSLIEHCIHIKGSQRTEHLPEAFFTDYGSFCLELSELVPNLTYLTKNVYQDYLADPSAERKEFAATAARVADRLGRSSRYKSATPDDMMEMLLEGDGGEQLLLLGAQSQRALGLPDNKLYDSLEDIDSLLSERGCLQFENALHYQIEHGYSVNDLFVNFARLARHIDVNLPEQERERAWDDLASLHESLMGIEGTLEFITPAALDQYRTTDSRATVVRQFLEFSATLDAFRHRPDGHPTANTHLSELLNSLGHLGAGSTAIGVLQRLMLPEAEGKEPLAVGEIALIFNRHHLSEGAWTTLGDQLAEHRSAGGRTTELIRRIKELDVIREEKDGHPDFWQHYAEVAGDLKQVDLPLEVLSGEFLCEYGKRDERHQVLLGLFARALSRLGEQLKDQRELVEFPEELKTMLADITAQDFGLTDNPAMVHKLNLMVTEGGYSSVAEFRSDLQELKMYALTDIMLNSPDTERQQWARTVMAREFNMGGPPYPLGTPEAKLHHTQTMEVVQRALRDNKGFGGLALDCRSVPSSEEFESVPAMMLRFAKDSTHEVLVANASTNATYPGKGLHLIGIDPEKVFAPDQNWEERGKSSPFWQWTEGEGLFAGEYFHGFDMEDFADAEFLFLRGVMAVMNPQNEKFEIDGVNYSYVVFNRHFYPGTEVACLIPTDVLQSQISSGLTPVDSYRGFDPERTDLSEDLLSYSALKTACEEAELNILNLTYGSVIGAGLCNAYLPGTDPHYLWERESRGTLGWKDSWGHTHKSWLLSRGDEIFADRETLIDSKLAFARDTHKNIYTVTRALQAELDAFRFALSFYKMGNTLTQDSFRDDPGQSSEEEQFMDDSQQEQPEFDQESVHEYRYRMLEEAYRWHLGAQEGGWQRNQIPILHFAYVLEPNLLPPKSERLFELDLADMKLTTPEGEFQLPTESNGLGEEEREIWRKKVVPFFLEGTGFEPRLLMRGGAYSLFE